MLLVAFMKACKQSSIPATPLTKRKGKDDFSTNPKANKVLLIGSDRNFRKKTDSLQ